MADVTLETPLAVPAPTTKYASVKVFLSIAPRELDDGTLDYTMSVRFVPYRVVAGAILDAPEKMTKTLNIGTIADGSAAAR